MSAAAELAPPAPDAKSAAAMASGVLKHLMGGRAPRVRPLGGGLTNFVFAARHGGEELVVRIGGDAAKVKEYLKEQWAMARAREVGVPVPEVLEVGVGHPIPLPYMVSRRVEGVEGTHHPARMAVLREMGRFARLLHGVPTRGFGHTFDWSDNLLSRRETWPEYLQREFRGEARLEVLERHGMLAKPALRAVRATLRAMAKWEVEPALNHGDLRLKNVVVGDEAGRVAAVLDWEFCTSNAAPHWDLSIALHDLSVDAKEEFLAGYGMRPAEMLEIAPALRAINVLNYAGAVEGAARERNANKIERLRARLHGALDLYAF